MEPLTFNEKRSIYHRLKKQNYLAITNADVFWQAFINIIEVEMVISSKARIKSETKVYLVNWLSILNIITCITYIRLQLRVCLLVWTQFANNKNRSKHHASMWYDDVIFEKSTVLRKTRPICIFLLLRRGVFSWKPYKFSAEKTFLY